MLNKELLLGYTKGQRKVKLTIFGYNPYSDVYHFGYDKDHMGSLDVLPYWGSEVAVIQKFLCIDFDKTIFYLTKGPKVTAHVKGYSKTITTGVDELGDVYSMFGKSGDIRYLTFDPPPTVTSIQTHSNQSRKKRSSLGGSKC